MLALAGLSYLCFVIYGSLVPLTLRPMSMAKAIDTFSRIRYLDLGIASRADWVANILLFIPLTFLWTGAFDPIRSRSMRALVSLAVFACALSLSVGIEFTQLFFPPRTVSINDIIAEGLGAVIGIALWWLFGQRFVQWLQSLPRAQGAQGVAERLLAVYLLLLLGYNLLPLDLTLSPVELYHKWREGRVLLVPFSAPYANRAQQVYDLSSDIAIWIPVAMLWAYAYKTSTNRIWFYVLCAAATLEFLQLFVYSRVSDVTDILTATIGGALGVWFARVGWIRSPEHGAVVMRGARGSAGLASWVALAFWLAIVLTVFWYPFNFNLDPAFARDRVREAAGKVPFEVLYFGTEYRAVTEVLHKAGFMFPLGALLGWIVDRGTVKPRGLAHLAAILLLVLVATGIEAGQLMLPGRISDLTDAMLESAGAVAGYFVCLAALGALRRPAITTAKSAAAVPGFVPALPRSTKEVPSSASIALPLAAGVAIVSVSAAVLPHLPGVPYNVAALLNPHHPFGAPVVLAVFVFWAAGLPALAARWLDVGQRAGLLFPIAVVLHTVVAWALMRQAVLPEMIHKVAGSPILGWPWEWETLMRFCALQSALFVLLTGGCVVNRVAMQESSTRALLIWLCWAACLLPMLHYVIVGLAATDNLTELMAGGGGVWSSSMIALWFVLVGAAGSMLGGLPAGRRTGVRRRWCLAVLSIALGYVILWLGLESDVQKYGASFSALQFLLSSDRQHYAAGWELAIRYIVFHAGTIGAIALTQLPFRGLLQEAVGSDVRQFARASC